MQPQWQIEVLPARSLKRQQSFCAPSRGLEQAGLWDHTRAYCSQNQLGPLWGHNGAFQGDKVTVAQLSVPVHVGNIPEH